MGSYHSSDPSAVFVAIDIAKSFHEVLIEGPNGARQRLTIANTMADFERLDKTIKRLRGASSQVAFEATGDYHRALATFLASQGFSIHLVSSLATKRTREARYNSWDKNDPKDPQVILHLLKTGGTQVYHDPLINGYHDVQELANTYQWKRRAGFEPVAASRN